MSNVGYRFINYSPGRYRARNGATGKAVRTKVEYQTALDGHVKVSHGGVEDKNCAGCRELRKKAGK